MKRTARAGLLAALSGCWLAASAAVLQVGSSEAEVLQALGQPIGTLQLRDRVRWLYPQGELTLVDGTVSELDLMDAEAFANRQAQIAAERADWQAQQAKLQAKHRSQGEALKREKLNSSQFAALPATDRVDYWRRFQQRYPEIDVAAEIGAALASRQSELEALETQARIAALEQRLAEAEKETAAARLEAEQLRREAAALSRQKNYGLRSYTTPLPVYRNYPYRPPTVIIHSSTPAPCPTGSQ